MKSRQLVAEGSSIKQPVGPCTLRGVKNEIHKLATYQKQSDFKRRKDNVWIKEIVFILSNRVFLC